MTTNEAAQVLARLRFERDDRDPPDERRRGQFKAGWEDATARSEEYAEDTLQYLTWHNLGYRFGRLLGHRSRTEIDEAYKILADLYDRPQARSRVQTLRLVSWNVRGRVEQEQLHNQVTALSERRLDIVAFQEVRLKATPGFKEELACIGLRHSTDSFSLAADLSSLTGPRQYGELIASRWPVTALAPDGFPVPWTERVLSAVIESPWGAIEIHTAHLPPGVTNGWKKIEMFEGIYRRLACPSQGPRILCGDFNSPQAETSDGRLVTWGQGSTGETPIEGTWRDRAGYEDRNERWDMGERNVLKGLAKCDLTDVYRMLHGYQVPPEFSWYWKGKGRRIGRRFDHVFASRDLNAVRCQYLHSLREVGLSDHSAIEADFEPAGTVDE